MTEWFSVADEFGEPTDLGVDIDVDEAGYPIDVVICVDSVLHRFNPDTEAFEAVTGVPEFTRDDLQPQPE